MKKLMVLPLILLVAFSFPQELEKGKLKFNTDYESGLKAAKEQGKPVLVYFWFEKWGPCKMLASGPFSDEKVAKAAEKLVLVAIDIAKGGPEHMKVAKEYGINSAPTLIFLDPDGKQVEKFSGKRTADTVSAKFDEVANKYGKEGGTTPTTDEKVSWADSVDKAVDASKESGKLVALLFAEDTEDEKTLKTLVNSKLKEFFGSFEFAKVKFEKDSDWAKKCNVESAPALALYDPCCGKALKTDSKFTTDSLKGTLKSGTWQPSWKTVKVTDLEKEMKKAKDKVLVELFVTTDKDKDGIKASGEFARKYFENFKDELVFLKVTVGTKVEDPKPRAFIISGPDAKPAEVKIAFADIKKGIKEALSGKIEWKCTSKDCGKTSDEPGDCCGKAMKKVKKGEKDPEKPVSDLEEITLSISGMKWPGMCGGAVKKALEGVPGVKTVKVNFSDKSATVMVEKDKKDVDSLVKAVEAKGFKAEVKN